MHLKTSSAEWQPFCHGLDVLNEQSYLHGEQAGLSQPTLVMDKLEWVYVLYCVSMYRGYHYLLTTSTMQRAYYL